MLKNVPLTVTSRRSEFYFISFFFCLESSCSNWKVELSWKMQVIVLICEYLLRSSIGSFYYSKNTALSYPRAEFFSQPPVVWFLIWMLIQQFLQLTLLRAHSRWDGLVWFQLRVQRIAGVRRRCSLFADIYLQTRNAGCSRVISVNEFGCHGMCVQVMKNGWEKNTSSAKLLFTDSLAC